MAGTRYTVKVDLENLNTSHSLAVLSVPPGSRVIDLGAADGSVARALRERGCTIWAVEFDPIAAAEARSVCDNVIVGDLEDPETWHDIEGQTFDVLLALDVLEHLREPVRVLARGRECLSPTGVAVVSLPNITHAAVRVSLWTGRFQYTELGLLDRTHLRFFDREGAERLLTDAGLQILERLRVRRGLEETEIAVRDAELSPELRNQLSRDPDSTTYQFVFVGRPASRSEPASPGPMLSERLQAENDRILATFAETERYARSLEAQLTAQREALIAHEAARSERDELRLELARRMTELKQRHLELRHCKADLAVKEAFIHNLREEIGRLEGTIRAFETYTNSAAFRLVERAIAALKRVPIAHDFVRAIVRKLAGRAKPRSS